MLPERKSLHLHASRTAKVQRSHLPQGDTMAAVLLDGPPYTPTAPSSACQVYMCSLYSHGV